MDKASTELSIREIDWLFTPFLHRKLNLRTRLVMSSLPRLLARRGVPTPEMLAYYEQRAVHQLGLIVTEPVAVNDAAAAADEGKVCFYGGEALRAWKSICRAVHGLGCCMAPLLSHAGMRRYPALPAIGPSGIAPDTLKHCGESMSRERIRTVVQAFAAGADAARRLGFDAVVINGGDAGLIDQFLRPETNHRHDEYGGDIVARARFACEVVHAVRKAVGRRFPVIFRFSQGGVGSRAGALAHTPAELEAFLHVLCEAGVDMFACGGQGPAFSGSPLGLGGWTRLLTQRPVIVEDGVGIPGLRVEYVVRRMRAGEFDLVSVGRALLADAAWGSKIRQGSEADILPFTVRDDGNEDG